MAAFYFRAVSPEGKVRTGTLAGASEREVARELRRQGLIPIYVGSQPRRGFAWRLPAWRRGRRRDVLFFTQELATLLGAGVPLDRALAITSELTERGEFRQVVQDVLRVLKGGKSLADSLATHPEYFSELYVNIVRAGEAGGALAPVFERLSEFERTRDELRNYILSSMIYPALLVLVGLGSITLMLYFVVPRFAQVFEESRLRMPAATAALVEASNLLKRFGWMALAAVAGAVAGLRLYLRTPQGRWWWDGLRLRLPLLGDALRRAETARFARAMQTLVANGVPLVQSLRIAAAILANRRMAQSLQAVAQGVKRGEGIAGPLRKTGQFPALAAHLLSVGEETGRLEEMFGRMAEIYENDTRTAIRRFTTLFEPLVILVMGVMVGILVLSMLLAITSINEVAI
ncbi:MAG: type II secretion system F family protein [Bryobacterales bacterium]|nr:type II secretion system F family protein [Bryobacteraceae bacterium]MDW8131195.1 type II secretion system F family protein [Bryobacterales bacterium]